MDLRCCWQIEGGAFSSIQSDSLKFLHVVNLSDTFIHGFDLISLASVAPNLKKLILWGGHNLKSSSFIDLRIEQFESLEEISIASTELDNQDVESLLLAAPNIIELDMSLCCHVRRGVFTSLPRESLCALVKVNLSGLDIDYNDIRDLLRAAPFLKWINLNDCPLLRE